MNKPNTKTQKEIKEQIIDILIKPRGKMITGVPHVSMAYKDEVKELIVLISEAYQKGRESVLAEKSTRAKLHKIEYCGALVKAEEQNGELVDTCIECGREKK